MGLKITKVNLPSSKYSIKAPYSMEPIGATIHETGNIASAMAEISFMHGNNRQVSYHFAVDDYRVVQGLPLNRNGWHSGDGGSGRGNRKTIGVEHCFNWNGKTTTENDSTYNPKYQEAIENGVELVANLFIQYPQWGYPESGKNIFQHHHHSAKNCPQRLRQENKWNDYVSRVQKRYEELKGIKPVNKKPVQKPDTTIKKANTGSVQEWMNANKSKWGDGSFKNRKSVATKHAGIKDYSGTANQNIQLLKFVKSNSPKPVAKKVSGKVSEVQQWLNKNYNTKIAEDNLFGPNTKKATIKALQTEINKQYGKNLVIDGSYGPASRAANLPVKRGANGNITRIIQGILIGKGYDPKGFDGSFGPGLEAAVKQFQQDHRLQVDGIVGPNTWAKLLG